MSDMPAGDSEFAAGAAAPELRDEGLPAKSSERFASNRTAACEASTFGGGLLPLPELVP